MPTHCTHLSLTGHTELFHWAVTSGSLLLVHKPHYRRIAIKKGSTLWLQAAVQRQGSAFANNENDCLTCDSRIGYGTGGLQDDSNTCGNEATIVPDNGDKHIKAMGYILVQ